MIKKIFQRSGNLLTILKYHNQRLKGPDSQRSFQFNRKQEIENLKEKERYQRELQKQRQSLKNLYHYGYTAEQLINSSEMVKRVFQVQNSKVADILRFKISRAVKKFQKSPTDFGSAAVQCAVMSERIIQMIRHVKHNPKDFTTTRALTRMIQKRRDMLNYLMRTDFHYYRWVCTEYSIPETFPKYAHHFTNFRGRHNSSMGI